MVTRTVTERMTFLHIFSVTIKWRSSYQIYEELTLLLSVVTVKVPFYSGGQQHKVMRKYLCLEYFSPALLLTCSKKTCTVEGWQIKILGYLGRKGERP